MPQQCNCTIANSCPMLATSTATTTGAVTSLATSLPLRSTLPVLSSTIPRTSTTRLTSIEDLSASPSDATLIAGAVVGSLVVVSLLVVCFYFTCAHRRKAANSATPRAPESDYGVVPAMVKYDDVGSVRAPVVVNEYDSAGSPFA